VVEDLAAAIAFFVELGLELAGETTLEGAWVDQLVGLEGVRSDIAVVRTRTARAGSSCPRSIGRWPPAVRRGSR
jgi:catechol 2,3-dioxygenase-like lactoylglutathione lyase family enzyme